MPSAAAGAARLLRQSTSGALASPTRPPPCGPFGKEVRTVGQVTFDETRSRRLLPRSTDGSTSCIVNATGQYVAPGQPLLTIYSPMLVSAQEELLLAKRLQSDVADASADARTSASDLLMSARRRLAYWDIPESEIAEIERSGECERR